MRWAIGCASLLLVAAGCGSSLASGDGHSTATPQLDAPPIRAVDRSAEDLSYMWEPEQRGSKVTEICEEFFGTSGPADPPATTTVPAGGNNCHDMTDAEKAQLYAAEQQQADALRPSGPVRVVAELPVGERTVELAAWSNANGQLCLVSRIDEPGVSTTSGPFGACVEGSRCDGPLCLDEIQTDNPGRAFALAGVVPAAADLITITMNAGETRTYPLAGPLVPGFASQRVFMVDLGTERYRKIVVSAAGSALATREKDATQVAMEECDPEYSLNAAPKDIQAQTELFQRCMQAHGIPGPTRTEAPPAG